MRLRFCLLLLQALLVLSCSTTPPEAPALHGTWESIGSGWLLQITDSTSYTFYDRSASACLPAREGALKELARSLSLQGDTLSLKKGVITYRFIRRKELPAPCGRPLSPEQARDPVLNFEVFAETIGTHYAFFEQNGIDWDSLYRAQRSKIGPQSDEADLYALIEETQTLLHDNHASLEVPEEVEALLEEDDTAAPEIASEEEELPEYGDFRVGDTVFYHHVQEDLTTDSWMLRWGKLSDTRGYIQVRAMWLYADLGVPQVLKEEGGYVAPYVQSYTQLYEGEYINKEVHSVAQVMDRVMQDLSGMEDIVIDIRFNGGGQDAVAFEILSHFVPQTMQVATQKLRDGEAYTAVLPLYITGTEEAYTKPVYVLTSPQTGSAAEAFALASMALPHIKRIGAPTLGAMSTALEKRLPNGWAYSLSNEVYMDNQGQNYEYSGVPVDYTIAYPRERQPFFRKVVNDMPADKEAILQAITAVNARD